MNRSIFTVFIAIGELVAMAVLWLSLGAGPARAEMVRAEWIGSGVFERWNRPGNWGVIGGTGPFNFVPNNADGTTYSVHIDNGRSQQSDVVLDIDAEIDRLVITNEDFLLVTDSKKLTIRGGPGKTAPGIVGDIQNSGQILPEQLIVAVGPAGRTVRLFGGGVLRLDGDPLVVGDDIVAGTGTNPTLINDGDHTIRGSGRLGNDTLIIDNRGLIDAVVTDNTFTFLPLRIDPSDDSVMLNRTTGTLRASGGGTMQLEDGTFTNDGLIEVGDNSKIEFTAGSTLTNNQNGVLIGGRWRVISTDNPTSLTVPGNPRIVEVRADVILSGKQARWFQINSVERNKGRIVAHGGQKFRTNGDLTSGLSGFGEGSGGGAGSTTGQLGRSPAASPEPILADPDGSEFIVGGRYTQLSGETFVEDAIFGADLGLSIEGGLLWGNGRIIGNTMGTMIGPAATLRPGIEPDRLPDRQTGLLQVQGDLNLGGTLDIELNGTVAGATYDQVEVAGLTDLHGLLQVKLLGGFLPAPADEFVILTRAPTSQNPVVGVFANAPDELVTRQGTFDVRYTGFQVILSNFDPVPEPSAVVLLFAAATGGVSLTHKRRPNRPSRTNQH